MVLDKLFHGSGTARYPAPSFTVFGVPLVEGGSQPLPRTGIASC